jgi:hypothetical protein
VEKDGAVWVCSECGESSRPLDAACHHCGKLLCPDHAIWLYDLAFARFKGEQTIAIHCANCKSKHHHRARSGSAST